MTSTTFARDAAILTQNNNAKSLADLTRTGGRRKTRRRKTRRGKTRRRKTRRKKIFGGIATIDPIQVNYIQSNMPTIQSLQKTIAITSNQNTENSKFDGKVNKP
jgi:chorismate synthase